MSLSGALFVVHAVFCGVAAANDNTVAAVLWGVIAFVFACAALMNDEKKEFKIAQMEKKENRKDGTDDG